MEVDRVPLQKMYRGMLRIRKFEEAIWRVYTSGLMHGLAHLYSGEEAIAVGVCEALREDDTITSTHRGHGHCVAKGGDLGRMMAEVMGRVTGHCRGKGGSMHIADMSVGILGANGIVGGSFGIATGAALSAKMRGTDQVTVCFFGDGATNQGVFYEVMNMAGIWRLPVVYVCENNLYGQYTAADRVLAGDRIADRSMPFGIPAAEVDGTDVVAVHEATLPGIERARSGNGPSFLVCHAYRYGGHHVGDPGESYRPAAEIEAWTAKDPIEILKGRLLESEAATAGELEKIEGEVDREVAEAVESAKAAPYPDVEEVSEHVYA
ncbi:MAG: thiamine pyrophosphate-dependent dehydrogenase E1 component subunit alpha [Candidatus Latescibacteria bacterium]|nr:thiamine pyrophosphate-dependent dehydrogenase E1 component subunit alpha [Candidatus Latescibacterota bacterium]